MQPGQFAATVVVPTHRGSHRLPALLTALAEQDTVDPWEVVAVVDGRDPDTEAVLARGAPGLVLTVVTRNRAGGAAVALNAGVAVARGRVIIRCDDDLTPAPDMVRRHLAHHRDTDDVGVVGLTRDVLPDSPYARAYGRSATARALAASYARPEGERWVSWAAHNSVLRDRLEAVGGFDESFSYREDSDLGLRLQESGIRIVIDPDLEIEHRGAAHDAETRAARAWVSGASEVLFRSRHPSASLVVAPPAPRTTRARLWSFASTVLSLGLRDRRRAGAAGRMVDRALPRAPAGVGGRLVALVTEASAVAGRRHGGAAQDTFRAQKGDELDRERARR
ncbi:glycosyltransferase [Oryzobacter telluris]|uniref:glycosyltransferase n=1 Tax=Oryzobacter telluris TaxID=3149179 RepID=UPI00370DCDAC